MATLQAKPGEDSKIELFLTVTIPFIYLTNLLIAASHKNDFSFPLFPKIILLTFTVLGLYLWILSYLHLGRSFGVMPRVKKLNRNGLYRRLEHPMYLGIGLTLFCLSLLNGSLAGFFFFLLVVLPLLLIRAIFESTAIRKLRKTDGASLPP